MPYDIKKIPSESLNFLNITKISNKNYILQAHLALGRSICSLVATK